MVEARPRRARDRHAAKENQKPLGKQIKFQHFIPCLPSQDCLRLILEFAIGPDDKHTLYKWARLLCKRSIVLIEHPNFAQMAAALT